MQQGRCNQHLCFRIKVWGLKIGKLHRCVMQLLEIPHKAFAGVTHKAKNLKSRFLTWNCFAAFWPRVKSAPKASLFSAIFVSYILPFPRSLTFAPLQSLLGGLSQLFKSSYSCSPHLPRVGRESNRNLPFLCQVGLLQPPCIIWFRSIWDIDIGIPWNLLSRKLGNSTTIALFKT